MLCDRAPHFIWCRTEHTDSEPVRATEVERLDDCNLDF